MNAVDLIIIAVLVLSVLVGLWRGLISEVMALIIWIAAFWVADVYGPWMTHQFDHAIHNDFLRVVLGYGICFVVVLIIGGLLRFALHQLVDGTGLGGTDRLLGMVFGFVRGVLLVTLLVVLVELTSLAREPQWQDSMLRPQFDGMAAWLRQQVPPDIRHQFDDPNAAKAKVESGLHKMEKALPRPSTSAQASSSTATASSAAGPQH